MNSDRDDETHFDKELRRIKNRPLLAVLLLVGFGVVALGQLTGAIDALLNFSRNLGKHNTNGQAVYSEEEEPRTGEAGLQSQEPQASDSLRKEPQSVSEVNSPATMGEAGSFKSSVEPGPVQSTNFEETPGSDVEPVPAPASGLYENESYRLVTEDVQRSGETVRLTVVLEPVEGGGTFRAGGWYLVDDLGELWSELKPDAASVRQERADGLRVLFRSAIRLVPGIKAKGSLVFQATGSGKGTNFTLIGVEGEPRRGREIVLRGLVDDGS